jgi:hypothetical protein
LVQVGSGSVRAGSGLVQAGSRSVQAGFRLVQVGSGSVRAGSGLVHAGFTSVQAGSRSVQAGFRSVQAGFRLVQAGFRLVQVGSGSVRAGCGPAQGELRRDARPISTATSARGFSNRRINRLHVEQLPRSRDGSANPDWTPRRRFQVRRELQNGHRCTRRGGFTGKECQNLRPRLGRVQCRAALVVARVHIGAGAGQRRNGIRVRISQREQPDGRFRLLAVKPRRRSPLPLTAATKWHGDVQPSCTKPVPSHCTDQYD